MITLETLGRRVVEITRVELRALDIDPSRRNENRWLFCSVRDSETRMPSLSPSESCCSILQLLRWKCDA